MAQYLTDEDVGFKPSATDSAVANGDVVGGVIWVAALLVLIALAAWIGNMGIQNWWRAYRRPLGAYITGALLWAFLVWTYSMISGGLNDHDRFWSTVILPPIAVVLVRTWLRRYL